MKKFLPVIVIMILLFSASQTTGQMNPPHGHHQPGHHESHEGYMGDMNITGEVYIADAIFITLIVQPTDEANERMNRNQHMSGDLRNQIDVVIPKIIEFEDDPENKGYSLNDTIISEFYLNTTTLEDITVVQDEQEQTSYTIDSTDGKFRMIIAIIENQGVPLAWKWSFEISDYNYQSNTSKLAMLHQITSNGGRNMHEQHMQTNTSRSGTINETNIMDQNQNVPMYFQWEDSATIGTEILPVNATYVDNIIAINFPQSDYISYDPEIGVDIETLNYANNVLSELLPTETQFFETIQSPTISGLILAVSLIGLSIMYFSRSRR